MGGEARPVQTRNTAARAPVTHPKTEVHVITLSEKARARLVDAAVQSQVKYVRIHVGRG
jgi:hypothetical protein